MESINEEDSRFNMFDVDDDCIVPEIGENAAASHQNPAILGILLTKSVKLTETNDTACNAFVDGLHNLLNETWQAVASTLPVLKQTGVASSNLATNHRKTGCTKETGF